MNGCRVWGKKTITAISLMKSNETPAIILLMQAIRETAGGKILFTVRECDIYQCSLDCAHYMVLLLLKMVIVLKIKIKYKKQICFVARLPDKFVSE